MNKVKLCLLLLLPILSVTDQSLAQIDQTMRYELPIAEGENFYTTLSAKEMGLILFREAPNKYDFKNSLWEVIRLDTTFNKLWRREYLVDRQYTYLSHKLSGEYLYILFQKIGSNNKRLELVAIDVGSSEVRSYSIKNAIPIGFSGFEVLPNAILLSGYFNYKPLVLYYNFDNKIPKVLPGLYNEDREIIQLKINDGSFDIVLKGKTYDKKTTLFLNTFDFEGNLVRNIALDTEKGTGLLFGRSSSDGNKQVIAGVYGLRNSSYSRGVFLAHVDNQGEHDINFYNYSDFENFFNYMKEGRRTRVHNRIKRRKVKNKKLRFNYRLLVHDVKEVDGQYIMLGEAFYPKYKTVLGNYSGAINPVYTFDNGIYRSNRVFDGYRYTHAVIIGFDKKGKLLWDNSFEINDVTSFDLNQFVNLNIEKEKIGLIYIHDNIIRTKTIKEGAVLQDKSLNEIKPLFDNDNVLTYKPEINGLQKWYDNVFYAYGTQSIQNARDESVSLKRKVFFVNKLIYK